MTTTTTIVGNLTRDPELRFMPNGTALANLTVVVSRKWTDKNTGETKEQANFFDVTAWGKLAEYASESLVKGTRTIVTGRLEQQSWETSEGAKRSKIILVADDIGPSLRWATAEVFRAERETPDNAGNISSEGNGAPF